MKRQYFGHQLSKFFPPTSWWRGVRFVVFVLLASSAFAQPWEPHVIWDQQGWGPQSLFGSQILPLGDQNDDGYADWGVRSNGDEQVASPDPFPVQFFHGGNPPSQTPYLTFPSLVDTAVYARVCGDVNGDGYTDWAIYLQPGTGSVEIVRICFGGPTADMVPEAVMTIPGLRQFRFLPFGDYNGDGCGDVSVYYNDNVDEPVDSLEVYFGGPVFEVQRDWVLRGQGFNRSQAYPLTIGDLNGDGAIDFLVKAWRSPDDTLKVFLGSEDPDTVPSQLLPQLGTRYPIEFIGDINGDGNDDLYMDDYPSEYIYYGRLPLLPEPDQQITFPCSGGGFVSSAGDINDDGFKDFFEWDPDYCDESQWGRLALYLGGAWLNPNPLVVWDAWFNPVDVIGFRDVRGVGDVNRDGIDDWAIGAVHSITQGHRGRVVIIAGDEDLRSAVDEPTPELAENIAITAFPNPFNASAQITIHLPGYLNSIELRLYNLLGEIVRHEFLHVQGGEVHYMLVSGGKERVLSTGLYILHVQSGKIFANQKLVVLN